MKTLFLCVTNIQKKEASNPRKVTDFLKNYSLRDNLVSEDCQMSCFVFCKYRKPDIVNKIV
nr:MAG TPA: hypothetical protein [Caudoviricetes sp.]DAY16230.1 MAG TPA: hypothetical protein [Caudoviricetes sp.]